MPSVMADMDAGIDAFSPTAVLLHVGIVDCAPRIFTSRQQAFVSRIHPAWLRKVLLKVVHVCRRYIISTLPLKRYTSPLEFERSLQSICMRIQSTASIERSYVIAINRVPASTEHRSPGFNQSVDQFNQILKKATSYPKIGLIDFNSYASGHGGIDRYTVQDGIHLNAEGHRGLAQLIARRVVEDVEMATAT
jgi:hypothetical protein